ncbi:MAG: hypothetical protein A3J09_00890 [Candidatus Zambryskibacteria bacterium RIFCSPLOWO2_02_FULL_51_21]|uniref:Dipeptidylpeptidase IV N-terminal domain-containing protein n=1 Tax=Candidatus Zambryskibacteria bacterium RIFCSPHIGHO2_02_FULL_43_37 TaxID=1802749 RepID=A0A1G2THH3_9BACT|nr:MAG: hypothetical protein A2723_00890 [Candidatus Zambryskibacteria bacterium RIFCSPHIGHO2_01_FULL_52_18]OHA96755.1 MAG: hypothetical protein A3D49_02850 [Candidatus Zambryskibacteria bacterium RIFCSPHIGHO2_02_FULL_43_37]OHB07448.1 MAG: hypothetical protein A2944_01920 [Candidatus Zambryskibacteria bacterium RIFCSPLOWO2_01_FULL_52_12]OHB11111.1 MAG: hypothetical protein A3J09_00890 [Candidatus Zambryskibacteria bacterium RIFCSPLOWO2_02_FULL_51_21]
MKKTVFIISITLIFGTFLISANRANAGWSWPWKTNNEQGVEQARGQKAGWSERFFSWRKKNNTSESIVKKVTVIRENGGRVDWLADKDLIVFDAPHDGGFSDVFVMNGNGSGERCLTCNHPALPNKHMGNPAWHPSGEYVVFQAEKKEHPDSSELAKPGRGTYNDLWVIGIKGDKVWKLTDLPSPPATGVLHPHFSHNGKKLFWAQREKGGGLFGVWSLKVADFDVVGGIPRLSDIKTYQPGKTPKFYESHGFTKNDRGIIFSANSEDQSETGFDQYVMDLATGKLTNLVGTPRIWDEHGQLSNSGRKIVWASSRDLTVPHLDLWTMNDDGSDKKRLTYFNDKSWKFYLGVNGSPADSSWGPGDKKMVTFVITDDNLSLGKIVILDLK